MLNFSFTGTGETSKGFAMKNVTLKFPDVKRMLDFVRVACLDSYDLSMMKKTLTSNFPETKLKLAAAYQAIIVDNNALQTGT